MKIIVFSDSHTDVRTMLEVVEREKPDRLIHLGDHAADAEDLHSVYTELPISIVCGNTDRASSCRPREQLEVCGKKIFLTHGHLYGVKEGLGNLYQFGINNGYHLVLFGHTHIPFLSYMDTLWLMNPGRIGKASTNAIHTSYGVIRFEEERMRLEIVEV